MFIYVNAYTHYVHTGLPTYMYTDKLTYTCMYTCIY